MPSTEELRAELEVAELETRLVAEKTGDPDGRATMDTKVALREARARHRTLRAAHPPDPGDVRPDTIAATATVEGN